MSKSMELAMLKVWSNVVLHAHKWNKEGDDFWFKRLIKEVGELSASLGNDHKDPPEHELEQIAGICINWLALRLAKELEDD